MTRRAIIAMLALVAVTACGRKGAKSSDFDSATASALASGNAATASLAGLPRVGHVMAIELAHRLDIRGLPSGGVDDKFKPGDSVLVSVRTAYVAAGADLVLRLRQGKQVIDSVRVKSTAPDSNGVAVAGMGFGQKNPLSAGTYQVEAWLDGKFQSATPFAIKP